MDYYIFSNRTLRASFGLYLAMCVFVFCCMLILSNCMQHVIKLYYPMAFEK